MANGNGVAKGATDFWDPHAPQAKPDPTPWIPFEDHQLRYGAAREDRHHAAEQWLPPDERPPAPVTPPEVDHRRVRAVKAYCDRFCDPALADVKAAEAVDLFATRIQRRPNADEHSVNLELLRIARTVAAEAPMSGIHADGWRDKLVHSLAAERHADCVRASELLAARANDEIDVAERDELRDHLRDCERCLAVERQMLDAEQAFVDALEADEPPPMAAAEPRVVVSDPRKAAVEAYCGAVCGATAAAAAVDAWSSFEVESGALAEVPADEEELRLAALTRAVAARHLSSEIADDPRSAPECAATPRLLAARLNGLIDEHDLDALEQHLDHCESCPDVQARMIDAERLWSRELGHPLAAPVALAAQGERRRRIRPALIAVPAVIAGAILAIVLLSGSGGSRPAATAPPRIAQQVAITSSTTTSTATHAPRHRATAVHKPRHHTTTTAATAAPPTTTSSATFTQTTASTPPQTTPASFTPAPSSPAPSSPAPSSSPPPATTQSPPSQPSISNPSSTVGAAPAPQHGISGGKN